MPGDTHLYTVSILTPDLKGSRPYSLFKTHFRAQSLSIMTQFLGWMKQDTTLVQLQRPDGLSSAVAAPTPAANPPSGRLEQGKAHEDRTAVADPEGITSWGGVVGSKFNTYMAVSLRAALIQSLKEEPPVDCSAGFLGRSSGLKCYLQLLLYEPALLWAHYWDQIKGISSPYLSSGHAVKMYLHMCCQVMILPLKIAPGTWWHVTNGLLQKKMVFL